MFILDIGQISGAGQTKLPSRADGVKPQAKGESVKVTQSKDTFTSSSPSTKFKALPAQTQKAVSEFLANTQLFKDKGITQEAIIANPLVLDEILGSQKTDSKVLDLSKITPKDLEDPKILEALIKSTYDKSANPTYVITVGKFIEASIENSPKVAEAANKYNTSVKKEIGLDKKTAELNEAVKSDIGDKRKLIMEVAHLTLAAHALSTSGLIERAHIMDRELLKENRDLQKQLEELGKIR